MIDALATAVLDLLRDGGLRADDGRLGSDTALPAAVVHVFPGPWTPTSLDVHSDHGTHDVVLVLVGDDVRSVRWLVDQVHELVQDTEVDVPGRSCSPARQIASLPPDAESKVHPDAWSGSVTYRITSIPSGDTP